MAAQSAVGEYDLTQLPYKTPVPSSVMPEIGFVMNGGRRWSIDHGASLGETYSLSFAHIARLLRQRPAIALCAIYALTVFNLQRPRDQVLALLDSLPSAVDRMSGSGFTPIFYGDLARLGPEFHWMRDHNARTSVVAADTKLVVFAVAYSPYWEDWARRDSRQLAQTGLDASVVHRVDRARFAMVLTSGGGVRLRDFFPLACGYADLTFTEALFNDVNLADWYDESLARLAGGTFGR